MPEPTQTFANQDGANAARCPFSGTIDFPTKRANPFDPPPEFKALRAEMPIVRTKLANGQVAWLLTRYEDVREVLNHPNISSDTSHPAFPGLSAAMSVARNRYRTFVSMDPPEHTPRRRMLTGEFAMKRMEALRGKIQAIIDELLDTMLKKGPPSDLVTDFALPLPSMVICLLLGVPYDRHEFFQDRARILISNKSTTEDALKATRELCDEYIGDLIREKDANPQDDLLSRLVVNHLRNGDLTHHDVVSVARQLLVAGHETTANVIALGTLTLLSNPDQMTALLRDKSLVPSAVEEFLRYLDVSHGGRRRVAKGDIEICGQTIRAGEAIIAFNPSANRDDAIFADPDTFDVHRDARHHIAFGYGVHQCLGQPLARLELNLAFNSLLSRIPTLRLAVPFEEIQFKQDVFIYGIEQLPVTWS